MGLLGEEEEKQGEVDEGAMTRATWRRGRIARRSSMTTWRKRSTRTRTKRTRASTRRTSEDDDDDDDGGQ